MSLPLSVLIPAHDPRRDWLDRVLAALRAQTLPRVEWELILIDNASRAPLAETVDLSWHPAARVVREEQLGSSHARLRGVREATGDLLTFVDDDNVPHPDFLERALKVAATHPAVGVFGPGWLAAEYEQEPSAAVRPYLWILAQKYETEKRTSAARENNLCLPVGAGLCIRRELAVAYAREIEGDKIRLLLGRTGENLLACEDRDMALSALQQGFSAGIFPELRLTHLIAARRVEPDYLARLYEGTALSHALLERFWHHPPPPPTPFFVRLKRRYLAGPFARRVQQAEERGRRRGIDIADQAGL